MLYEIFNSIAIYFVLATVFLFLLPIFGRLNFISQEFYHNIIFMHEFFSYKQYLFWVLLFPFGLWLVSIVFFLFNLSLFVGNLWVVALIFWITLYVYIVFLLRRGLLLSKKNFLIIAVLSVLTTFAFNWSFYNQGLEFLLPQKSIWFWTLLFVFIISSFWFKEQIINVKYDDKVEKYIYEKANGLEIKYKKLLDDLSETQKKIFLSVLILENYNRPKFLRIIEYIFSYMGLARTTGLAQIQKKGLTDLESVEILKEKIKQECTGNIDLGIIRSFLRNHNGGNYDEMAIAILQNLDNKFIFR